MNTTTALTAASIASSTVTKAGNNIVSVSPSSSSANNGICDVDIAAPTLDDFNVNGNGNGNGNTAKTAAATMNVIIEEEPDIAAPVTTTITKSVIEENETMTTATITYNNEDVLCGRGKGIREHPGNRLYNKLLRKHYEEYANAPKGSKLSFVKIVVNTIRTQKPLGGRFLEHKNASIVYADIGDVRALNKTAQAFRDMRVAEEKRQHVQKRRLLFNRKQQQPQSTASLSNEKRKMVGREEGVSQKSALKTTSKITMRRLSPPLPIMAQRLQEQQQPRRPTYQERLKLFHQQQRRDELRMKRKDCSEGYEVDGSDDGDENCSCSSSSSTDDDNNDDGDNDSISDTETEDSFPFYNSSRNPTQKHTQTTDE